MGRFSERYGYIQPSMILIREKLTDEITNAICTAYDLLRNNYSNNNNNFYKSLEEYHWCYFLNNRLNDFYIRGGGVTTKYLEADITPWYKKMDLIETTINYLFKNKYKYYQHYAFFINYLNDEFKRLNFAYRIIDNQIVEVTSEEEICEITSALENPLNGIKEHLQTALKLLSKRPDADYRNSIKESISAVEALVREITGESTLNLKKLDNTGIVLPSVLRKAFELLYGYTNDESTGIRHALMDDTNTPGADEAVFMLVSCSAFINYLTKKKQ
ncbi:hypothetical protein EZS27_035756 [termite gut metagenome]|uniref:HEPN AbiJ-N-terminal domain-containing protein n=1 Tax=termite gut metagenome TaxID=433724 RepID=A0A5J4PV08_9ZZZZ